MKKLLLLASLVSGAASCSKSDDVSPAQVVTASFKASRKVVDVGEQITFTNNSIGATRYEWDFGDGQTSTQPSPAITYPATGTYRVTMKAYSDDNQVTHVSSSITAGRRRIGSFRILKMDFQTPTGQPWDTDGTGPDIRLLFNGASRTGGVITPIMGQFGIKSDVTPSQLPLDWIDWNAVPFEPPVNGNFTFAVEEADIPTITFRTMVAGSVFTLLPSLDRDSNGSGSYSFSSPDGLWQLVFYYKTTP